MDVAKRNFCGAGVEHLHNFAVGPGSCLGPLTKGAYDGATQVRTDGIGIPSGQNLSQPAAH